MRASRPLAGNRPLRAGRLLAHHPRQSPGAHHRAGRIAGGDGLRDHWWCCRAYFGGMTDMLVQRLADAFQAFPPFILLLLFTQTVDHPSQFSSRLYSALWVWQPWLITRSAVLAAKKTSTCSAADRRCDGRPRHAASHPPTSFSPIIVIFTSAIGAYILAEAGLAFLGLGDARAISWGKMVNEGVARPAVDGAVRWPRPEHDGARVQPRGRRPARRARPAASRPERARGVLKGVSEIGASRDRDKRGSRSEAS